MPSVVKDLSDGAITQWWSVCGSMLKALDLRPNIKCEHVVSYFAFNLMFF